MPLVGVYHGRYRPSGPAENVDFAALLPGVPGVSELEAEGFVPLETLLGQTEFGSVWPAEHRRVVDDTRYEQVGFEPWPGDEATLYMVRSPWPGIDIDTVIKLMWRWVFRNEDRYATDENQRVRRGTERLAIVEEYFRQPEAWVRAYNRGRVNRVR